MLPAIVSLSRQQIAQLESLDANVTIRTLARVAMVFGRTADAALLPAEASQTWLTPSVPPSRTAAAAAEQTTAWGAIVTAAFHRELIRMPPA